jgi:hypothetical protein
MVCASPVLVEHGAYFVDGPVPLTANGTRRRQGASLRPLSNGLGGDVEKPRNLLTVE